MGGPNPNPFPGVVPVNNGGTGTTGAGAQIPWMPVDNALLQVSAPPDDIAGATQIMTAGTVYLVKLQARAAFTITNLWFITSTAGTGASTGSFAGIYNSAGTLLTGSADIAAAFTAAAGPQSVAVTTPQAIAAGSFVWATLIVNLATTQPTLRVTANNTPQISNLNLAAAAFRAAANGTALTALPASITPSANAQGVPFWIGAN